MQTLLITALVSQNLFARTYGGTGYDEAHCVIQTADGGYAISGYTESFGPKNLLVLKLSSTGDISWAKLIETRPPAFDYGLSCVIQTADNGFAIVSNTSGSGTADDCILLKLSPDGNLEWAKTYGGTGLDYAQVILQLPGGGYALYGGTWSFGSSGWGYFLAELTSSGDVVWARYYSAPDHDNGSSLIRTQDGGYAMGGYTRAYGTNWDSFVLKVNSSGGLEWANAYGGNQVDGACYLTQTSELGYLLVGETKSFGVGLYDIMIVKTNASGVPQWAKVIGGTADELQTHVLLSQDGGFLIAGKTASFGAGDDDLLIFKMDNAGTLLWAKSFAGASGDMARRIALTSDGGFAIAGMTQSFGAGAGDFLVIKANASGDYSGCLNDLTPQVSNITVNVTPASLGTDCVPIVTNLNPAVTNVNPAISDVCEALHVGEVGFVPPDRITCYPVSGGLVFLAQSGMSMKIYSPDGRMAYSGQLAEGQTRIPLDQGVYLWQAGPYKGKAVVR